MKLFNYTRCPTKIVKPVLLAAARANGISTNNVLVLVSLSDKWVNGEARDSKWFKKEGCNKRLPCCGSIKITIATKMGDPFAAAYKFYSTAAHEWGHIDDYRNDPKRKLPWSRNPRHKHDSRPQEKRANAKEQKAEEKVSVYAKDIMKLAKWIAASRKKK